MNAELLVSTRSKIVQWVKDFKAPCILSSFGKDSMVMTHVCRKLGLKLPIVYHRNHWQPEKNRFADNTIYSWGLEVHDWSPCETGVKTHEDCIQTVSRYQIGPMRGAKGPPTGMNIPNGILEPEEGKSWICGLNDILGRPKATFVHPWDLMLQGQKNSDVDIFEGPSPLNTDLFRYNETSPTMAFPLREWNDDDIWDYIEEFNVPVQKNRYDVKNRREYDCKDFNNDYVRACTKCIDRRQPHTVMCPLVNREIPNVSAQIPDFEQAYAYIA